jgi:hypothetical protein
VIVYGQGECTSVFSVVRGAVGLRWCHYARQMPDGIWQTTAPLLICQLDRKSQEFLICTALAIYVLGFDIVFHIFPFLVQFFNAQICFLLEFALEIENELYFGRFRPAS